MKFFIKEKQIINKSIAIFVKYIAHFTFILTKFQKPLDK